MKPESKSREALKSEYDFDYAKAKPNRFAGRLTKERVVVLLDPEVSKVSTDSEPVHAKPNHDLAKEK